MNACRNMTKLTKLAALATLATLTIALTAAPAASGPIRSQAEALAPGALGGPGALLPLLLRSVDLTDAQRLEIKAIVASHRARIGRLFLQLGAAQRELADHLYGTDAVDDESVELRIQRVEGLRTELVREGIAAVLEARRVLTAEQIESMAGTNRRYRDLRAEMKDLFRPAGGADASAEGNASAD